MKSDHNKKELIKALCSSAHHFPLLELIGEEQCVFNHEEADVNIISYLLLLYEDKSHVQIIADDTDIFILLVYHVWKHGIRTQVTMKKNDGRVIDINATVSKHGDKCKDLLPMHALSGCDTVSYPFGRGKIAAANLLLKNTLNLEQMCDSHVPMEVVDKVGTNFLVSLYGGKEGSDLNELRYQTFSKKRDPPKIKSLPPTFKSAVQHVRRAYLQTLIWCAADTRGPPDVDITTYGWELKSSQEGPVPVYGPATVAPPSVLKVVACSCKAQPPCATNRCTCRSGGLSCTTYCQCEVDTDCENDKTSRHSVDDSDSE